MVVLAYHKVWLLGPYSYKFQETANYYSTRYTQKIDFGKESREHNKSKGTSS